MNLIRELSEVWGEWQREPRFPFRKDHCVNGTRVAIEVLHRFGVEARPLSVAFILFNRFAWELYNEGVPADEWPEHAWSLGVGPEGMTVSIDDQGEDRWNGHLVAEGDNWTLDISAGQFDRPGRIVCRGPRVMPALPAKGWVEMIDNFGQILAIRRWPENNAWRHAPGWKRLHAAETAELEARLRIRMTKRLENL